MHSTWPTTTDDPIVWCVCQSVCHTPALWKRKVKGHTLDKAPLTEGTSLQKRSGMARVVEGFNSFTCTPKHLSTNGLNHTSLCLPSWSWSSFTDPGGMEGWVGPGTTMVSKQSAQDRYMTGITVVSCSDHHASLGNWSAAAMRVKPLTSRAMSRDSNHWATPKHNCAKMAERMKVLFESGDSWRPRNTVYTVIPIPCGGGKEKWYKMLQWELEIFQHIHCMAPPACVTLPYAIWKTAHIRCAFMKFIQHLVDNGTKTKSADSLQRCLSYRGMHSLLALWSIISKLSILICLHQTDAFLEPLKC